MNADPSPVANPSARWVFPVAAALIGAAILAFQLLKPSNAPPPADIVGDDLLVKGRVLFLDRCASCHGQTGKGDGPIARTLKGGKAEDFTATPWKYGETAEAVRKIVAAGTPDGQMPGWGRIFTAEERDAAAAYAFYLGKRQVPDELRPKKAGGG